MYLGAALATDKAQSRSRSPNRNGSKMTTEQIIGFALLAQLLISTIIYSMGYRDGKSVGYHHGRSVGMAMTKPKVDH